MAVFLYLIHRSTSVILYGHTARCLPCANVSFRTATVSIASGIFHFHSQLLSPGSIASGIFHLSPLSPARAAIQDSLGDSLFISFQLSQSSYGVRNRRIFHSFNLYPDQFLNNHVILPIFSQLYSIHHNRTNAIALRGPGSNQLHVTSYVVVESCSDAGPSYAHYLY